MEDWKVAIRKYLLEENKMKRKVLVTGANGYVGRHVVKALLDKGCEVIASDFKFDGVDYRILVKIFAQFVIRISILNPRSNV